jgi:hypothetical protein
MQKAPLHVPLINLRFRFALISGFIALILCFTLHEYWVEIHPYVTTSSSESPMLFYWKAYALIASILALTFSAVILLFPRLQRFARVAQARWRPAYTCTLLSIENLVVSASIIVLSNRQFGAFDQSIVVDTLWRQASGQIPYRDFATTNPPLFVLGLHLGAKLFGSTWNSQALLLASFSAITSIWIYWLARRLDLSRVFACLAMLCSQIPGLFLLSFWWFNNTTAVVAGIFLLSSIFLLKSPERWLAQMSYVISLAALLLVKPNTAGLLFVLISLILFIAIASKLRFILLTAAGAGISALTLILCHVSPMLVLRAYLAVAQSRGLLFLAFGINPFYTAEIYFQFACFSGALLLLLWKLWHEIRARSGRDVARYLILLVGALVGLFALASNGDIPDVALPPTLLAICVVAFEPRRRQKAAMLFYAAFLCATISTEAFKGVNRLRIRLIGTYFVLPRLTVPVQNDFFAHMRTGPMMNVIASEAADAVKANPGPIFFTDRLEWMYAALSLPSPAHLPVFWQKGTSYGSKEESKFVDEWSSQQFPTVLQGRASPYGIPDWVYSPDSLHRRLSADYVKDDQTYPWLIVWRRRPSGHSAGQ